MQLEIISSRNRNAIILLAVSLLLVVLIVLLLTGCKEESASIQTTPQQETSTQTDTETTASQVETTTQTVTETVVTEEPTTTEAPTTESAAATETTVVEETSQPNSTPELVQIKADLDINVSDKTKLEPLLNSMLTVTGNMTKNMGIYYYDIVSRDMISINAERQFRSASTAKIFVVMALYEAAATGELSLDQVVYYTDSDYEGGSGILQNMDLSRGYELGQLAEFAIKHSDNIAFHMIRRAVGRDNCYSFYESIIGHPTNRSQTQMSAIDAGKLLTHAYTYPDGRFDTMIEHMRTTDFEHAIPKHLAAGSVSNKIGFYLTFFHDAALIHDGAKPYILTIFSDSLAADYGVEPASVLADLSLEVYTER